MEAWLEELSALCDKDALIKLCRICTEKPFGCSYINAAANDKKNMLFDPVQTRLAQETTHKEHNYLKQTVQLIPTCTKLTVRIWLFLILLAGTTL